MLSIDQIENQNASRETGHRRPTSIFTFWLEQREWRPVHRLPVDRQRQANRKAKRAEPPQRTDVCASNISLKRRNQYIKGLHIDRSTARLTLNKQTRVMNSRAKIASHRVCRDPATRCTQANGEWRMANASLVSFPSRALIALRAK